MDNKKIGDFIKKMMKSKGMNQEDLARAIGISPQAVSKSLNGTNTFDIGNLQIISELFKITIDDILRGDLQTSTSFMTDQERIVRLGYNAVESAEPSLLLKFDGKEKYILDYAIVQENVEIIKLILDRRYFERSYSIYSQNLTLLKILMDNELFDQMLQLLKFSNFTNLSEKATESKELWLAQDEKIIDKIYFKDHGSSSSPNGKWLMNLDQAVRFNNRKVIDLWFESYAEANVAWSSLPGFQTAIIYNNLDFIKKLFKVAKINRRFHRVRTSINAFEAYNSSETLFDYLLQYKEDEKLHLSFSNTGKLLEHFFNNQEFAKLNKYKSIGTIPSSIIDRIKLDEIELDELMYLFMAGGMPTVVYNNKSSVENYVENVNKIILRLISEILHLKKKK